MRQDLFKGKYRISSARLQCWDYGANGAYFVTICTKDKYNFFGEIVDQKMILSRVGILADVLWYEIRNHAQHITLGDFVVMPNHIHGILILDKPDINNSNDDIGDRVNKTNNQTHDDHQTIGQKRFQNQGKNTLSSMVGGYKSAVTKHCNRLGLEFAWQPRFYDHIIRDHSSFLKISEYIRNNPIKWEDDRFYNDY